MLSGMAVGSSASQRIREAQVSSVDAIALDFKERILSGEFEAGFRVKESVLAVDYAVSRHTVRSALARLQQSHLLTFEANVGWSLPVLDEEGYRDLHLLREAVEVTAFRIAAEAGRPWMDETQAAYRDISLSRPSDDYPVLLRRDIRLHRQLVAEARSPRLLSTYEEMQDELRLWWIQAHSSRPDCQFTSFSEWKAMHISLADAVRAGDVDRVERLSHSASELREGVLSSEPRFIWAREVETEADTAR